MWWISYINEKLLKNHFCCFESYFFLLLFISNPNDRNTHINIHFLQVLLMFYSIFGIISLEIFTSLLLMFYSIFGIISLEIFTSLILFFYVFSKLVKKISEIFIALYLLLDSRARNYGPKNQNLAIRTVKWINVRKKVSKKNHFFQFIISLNRKYVQSFIY